MKKRELIYLDIDQIKPWDKNPRDNEFAVEPLVKSIQEFGFNVPVIINPEKILIAGHTRILAAKKLGLKEVPAIILDHLTKAQEMAYAIADNKIASIATWKNDFLSENFQFLKDVGYDLSQTGFNETEIQNTMSNWQHVVEESQKDLTSQEESQNKMGKITIKCHEIEREEIIHFIEMKLKETSFIGVSIK